MDGPQMPLPRKVGAKGQVQLPPELMREIGARAGDLVWIGVNPSRSGTLIVLSPELMDEIYRKGYTALS